MKIEEIDSNFNLNQIKVEGEKVRYILPHSAFDLYGLSYDKTRGFVRMDPTVAQKVNDGVYALCSNTAGGRVRFATDSSVLQIDVAYPCLTMMSHMALTGSSGFSLFEETDKGERFIKNLAPLSTNSNGFSLEACLGDKKMRDYVLYFPLYNDVKSLAISLDKTATVTNGKKYEDVLPILYYGSSITQGGCASRPDNSYQALISKWSNVDFINLGFSGSALGEDVMVDYLATINCSVFVCDYDHNTPSVEHLRQTHYRLYKRYREKRPQTPILFISKPDFGSNAQDGERLKIIYSTYLKAKRQGDKNVYFLSGKKFYNGKNRWDFTVDGIHPTDLGFSRMATEIYKKIKMIYRGK